MNDGIATASVEALTAHRSLQCRVGHCVPTCQAFGALRLLGSSSGVEWFEIAFIKGLGQRT
jgi:hypothetical protein